MYLREMGSVELLSREGEIAIAKRIEAGRDMMIGGLCESPLTFRAIVAWHDALKAGRMLLRDIIDLEATQGGPNTPVPGAEADAHPPGGSAGRRGACASIPARTTTRWRTPKGRASRSRRSRRSSSRRCWRPSKRSKALTKKQHKMQSRRLETMTSGEEMSARSEKSYEKLREELVSKVEQVRLHNNRIEELVMQLKQLNQRLTALEGALLRMAESCKVPRDDFLHQYRGHELDPNWMERVARAAGQGVEGVRGAAHRRRSARVRAQIAAIATEAGLPISEFRRVYATVSRGERDSARARRRR